MSRRGVVSSKSSDSEDDTTRYSFESYQNVPFYQDLIPKICTSTHLVMALEDHLKIDLATHNPYDDTGIEDTLNVVAEAIRLTIGPAHSPPERPWYGAMKPHIDSGLTLAQRAVAYFHTEINNDPVTGYNGIDFYGFMAQLWQAEKPQSNESEHSGRAKELRHALDIITGHFISQVHRIYDVTVGLIRLLNKDTLLPGTTMCIPREKWAEVVQEFLEVYVAQNQLQLDTSKRAAPYQSLAYSRSLSNGELKTKFVELMLLQELAHVEQHPFGAIMVLFDKFSRKG
ncbi:hypothetical protein H4R35_007078 [Dimargaris xerosporica]|nr:hypothetical protein H4R35_007078 [Dimargaris xerosporica]